MYARVASFEGTDIKRLREMTAEQAESEMPALPEGIRHAFVLADEEGGRQLFITFFDSREAVQAAEQRFESMGDEISEDVRGRRTSVDVYEVVVDQAQ